MSIDQKSATVALQEADGNNFERFCQSFLAAIEGADFIPLGGVQDGGADGFGETPIFESTVRPEHFYQFTIQENFRTKIKGTIARLREFGRTPRALTYMTSKEVSHIDKEEDDLSDELGVRIRIRDQKYIVVHINSTHGAQAAFDSNLKHYLTRYKNPGVTGIVPRSETITDPSVYVFLEQEVSNRLGNTDLIKTVTDSLILWALSDTDPDLNKFMTRIEILQKILQTVPWAKQFISAQLDGRLIALSSKQNSGGREIGWHRKEGLYCLPFETRKIVTQENANDVSLKIEVINELRELASTSCDLSAELINSACKIAIRTVEIFFEKEGLKFSYFLSGNELEFSSNTVSDRIEEALHEFKTKQENYQSLRELVTKLLRNIFYYSTEKQREYLYHLSRTYVLFFTLQADPRIIEYFQGMTSGFHLYVGSDILIRALTERYLKEEDQQTRNMLRLAHACGVKLLLSEPILDEVFHHIQGSNYEFVNHMAEVEPYITMSYARHSPKILIRTYFYAKEKGQTSGWKAFLGQFLTYESLWDKEGKTGKDELRVYLTSQFSLEYQSKADLETVVQISEVQAFAQHLIESGEKKEKFNLAYNDALMVHAVYGLRRVNRETSKTMEYGYQTWWLTQETRIQRYTVGLVMDHGMKYIMRPEFLLNYFALSPTKADVLASYRSVFPTSIGLQMGHRLRENDFHKVLAKVKEWTELEPGRRTSRIQKLGDMLKTDQKRNYQHQFSTVDDVIDNEFL